MTEQYSLDLDEAQFAKMLFDHVREMSKDVAGVTRQGYGPLETQVLEYLKGIGGKLDLDIQTDLAGNVWMTLPGTDRILPAFVSGSHADSVLRRSCRHCRSALRRPLDAPPSLHA